MFSHYIRSSTIQFRGFTLIELLITVAIMGILASVAYPSYTAHVSRSNRAEALRELIRVANLQEQFYVDNRRYTGDLKELGYSRSTWNKLESNNYRIRVMNNSAASGEAFRLRAEALSSQATNDASCKNIYIDEVGNKTATSADCWD